MKTSPIQTHSTFFEREVACDRLSKIILTSTPTSSPLHTKKIDKTFLKRFFHFCSGYTYCCFLGYVLW